MLGPIGGAVAPAAAVVLPTGNPVRATPGSSFPVFTLDQPHFLMRRMLLEKFGVIDDAISVSRDLDIGKIGEHAVAIRLVMTVSLSIRRDMDELRPFMVHDRALKTLHKMLRVEKEIVETYRFGDRPVIKKDVDRKRRVVLEKIAIGFPGVDMPAAHVLPGAPVK